MRLTSLLALLVAPATAAAEPTTAVTTDPLGVMYESYVLSIARSVSKHLALRAELAVSPDSAFHQGIPRRLSAGVPIYFHAPFQGPFVEPGAFVLQYPGGCGASVGGLGGAGLLGCTGSELVAGPSIAVGWQTTLDSGFTISAAIGAARVSVAETYPRGLVLPTSSLRVGYAW